MNAARPSPSTAGYAVAGANTLSVDALKASAARDPKAAIKEAAKQFEAIFMQQLMKSMRDATENSGMMENAGTKLGTDLLDTQFAAQMTGLKGGLSDVIVKQLERQMAGTTPGVPPMGPSAAAGGVALSVADKSNINQRQSEFVRVNADSAKAAETQSGIPAAFMVGQAAHETGWGRHAIRNADGSDSHNLFGIKAGAGWTGPVAEITTTEYVNGEAQKVTAKFRSYASADESFKDYARMLKESPRYSGVVATVAQAGVDARSAAGFAQGLQKAGYATDPAYADKLTRVINTTLRMQRIAT